MLMHTLFTSGGGDNKGHYGWSFIAICQFPHRLLTLPKTRRHKNKVILHETKRSVSDVNRAQVTLRQLSMRLATPTLGVALTEERPQSAETCLEYQDMPDGR